MARTTEFSNARSAGSSSRERQSDPDTEGSLGSTSGSRAQGRSFDSDRWKSASLFGAGVALGALIGASAALLLAPQSGEETREYLSDRAQRLGGRVGERFDDMRGDLGWYMRRGRRKLRRGASRSRWAGEDLADRVRKGW